MMHGHKNINFWAFYWNFWILNTTRNFRVATERIENICSLDLIRYFDVLCCVVLFRSLRCHSLLWCCSAWHTHISWRWTCNYILWPQSSFTLYGASAGLEWASWRFAVYIRRFYATLWRTLNGWAPSCTLAQRMFVICWTILDQISLLFF